MVPPGTGKPFILGASLLTDSCVDWKVGCMLHKLRLHLTLWAISLWPALPPLGPAAPQPTMSSNAPIATHSHPPTHSNQPSSPLYFCLFVSPAIYHPVLTLNWRIAIVSLRPSAAVLWELIIRGCFMMGMCHAFCLRFFPEHIQDKETEGVRSVCV